MTDTGLVDLLIEQGVRVNGSYPGAEPKRSDRS